MACSEFQALVTLLTPHNTELKIPVSLCKNSSCGLTAELLRCKYSDDNFPNENYEKFGWTRRENQKPNSMQHRFTQ
ncbi:hypothetical protein PS6_005622 [Mucor atramentarius]